MPNRSHWPSGALRRCECTGGLGCAVPSSGCGGGPACPRHPPALGRAQDFELHVRRRSTNGVYRHYATATEAGGMLFKADYTGGKTHGSGDFIVPCGTYDPWGSDFVMKLIMGEVCVCVPRAVRRTRRDAAEARPPSVMAPPRPVSRCPPCVLPRPIRWCAGRWKEVAQGVGDEAKGGNGRTMCGKTDEGWW